MTPRSQDDILFDAFSGKKETQLLKKRNQNMTLQNVHKLSARAQKILKFNEIHFFSMKYYELL